MLSNRSESRVQEALAAQEEIESYEKSVDRALRKKPHEQITVETPLDKIFASEESPHCPNCGGEIEAASDPAQWEIRNETVRRFAEFCGQDGLEPWQVMRNAYAVFAHLSLPVWSALSAEEKSAMLGDFHKSRNFRINLCAKKGRGERRGF
jgi:hypothetical protein